MKEGYLLYNSIYVILLKRKDHGTKEQGLELGDGFGYKEA